MLPLPLTFGLVPTFIDLCKCRSSWICIFVLNHMFLSELFFGNLTRKLIYLCFALCVSQVSDSTIIVIWKCIEFALLTIDLLSFKAYYPHRLMFLYVLVYIQICSLLCCHCLTRLNLEFFLDWSIIECFCRNTISLGGG